MRSRSHRTLPVLALCLTIALLAGCATKPSNLEPLYQHARDLRNAGRLNESSAATEKGLASAPDGSPLWWKFYLHKIHLVQQTQGAKASAVLLAKQPPGTLEFRFANAQRKLYLAWASSAQTDYAAANTLSAQALDLARATGDLGLQARIEFFRVSVLTSQRQLEQSEQLRLVAKEHVEASKDPDVQIYGMAISSWVLIEGQRFEEAILALQQQLSLLTQTNSRSGIGVIYLNIGWSRFSLGQLDEALIALETAEKLCREAGDQRTLASVMGDMGNIYLDRQQYKLALERYQGAFQISNELGDRSTAARWLTNLANVAIERKDWVQADEINQRAMRLKEILGEETSKLYAYVSQGRILEGRGKTAEAEKLYKRIAEAHSIDPVPALQASTFLALLYAGTGQDAKAEAAFEATLEMVDRVRSGLKEEGTKIQFLTSLIRVHENYIDFLMARGKTGRGLEIAEASRAQVLQQKIGEAGAGRMVGTDGYQRLARETGTTLLSYWLGPRRSYVWITTGGAVSAYPLPAADKIGAAVERYRGLIEALDNPLASDDGAGHELYEAILAPVIDRIPRGTRLIIAPTGALNALNFETIPVPAPRAHYFIEDAVVSVAPSLNLLVSGSARREMGGAKMLLIGDPNPPDREWSKLPFAAEEIDRVKKHFAPSEVLCFRKDQANPAAYRNHAGGGSEYVHFTAHASSDRQNPMESAIILSGPLGSNRLLARDVARNKYPAGLVTISACRGAGAKTYAGEGLVGFMWAFFRAGARNIIAGLWDVSDESTPQLMDNLYGELTRAVPAADALRNSKLKLLRSGETYQLPYYWGPFQLYIREAPAPGKLSGKQAHNAQDRNREMARQVLQAPDVRPVV